VVFDDDPQGVEAFLAAGAHIEGVKDLPLTPLGFATWRNESHTAAVLSRHGAQRVEEAHDQDLLVRQTMETVTGVQELLKRVLISAEGEYHKQRR